MSADGVRTDDDKEQHLRGDTDGNTLQTGQGPAQQNAVQDSTERGVVYLSRIPPHMRPQKMRHLLEKYGEINRLYLAPEDPGVRKIRRKLTGSTGKYFNEGWVEFMDKKVAKKVAAILNGRIIGGKIRSDHYYDLWTIKYLPKFKWDHLTEEITYQKAIREQKMANEIAAAKRERDFYLSRVDKAKARDSQQQRRKKKEQQQGGASGRDEECVEGQTLQGHTSGPAAFGDGSVASSETKALRTFSQKRPMAVAVNAEDGHVVGGDVLSLIGGKKKRQPTA